MLIRIYVNLFFFQPLKNFSLPPDFPCFKLSIFPSASFGGVSIPFIGGVDLGVGTKIAGDEFILLSLPVGVASKCFDPFVIFESESAKSLLLKSSICFEVDAGLWGLGLPPEPDNGVSAASLILGLDIICIGLSSFTAYTLIPQSLGDVEKIAFAILALH